MTHETMMSINRKVRAKARGVRARIDRIGRTQTESAVVRESRDYWRDATDQGWKANSHWEDGVPGEWSRIGADHLDLLQRLVRTTGRELVFGRTVEWGSGGGANAVRFAPLATEFVSVDVSQDSLTECERQTQAVCETPVVSVLIDVDDPEAAIESLGAGTCDLFVCLYVVELLPSRSYAQRILAIAQQLLKEGGVAFIQFKYENADRLSKSARRSYRRNLANTTTFPIDEFWEASQGAGLHPQVLHLVPRNALDERYGYLLCTRPFRN